MGSCIKREGYELIEEGDTITTPASCGMLMERAANQRAPWSMGLCLPCARRLEIEGGMGEEDLIKLLGCCKISWRHVFCKLRAELRRKISPRPTQKFRYDALSYAQNFDEEDPHARQLSFRFTSPRL